VTACPIRPDEQRCPAADLEVVFFTDSNYTVGSSFGGADEALVHASGRGQGTVVSYITAPDWRAHDVECFPEGIRPASVLGKLEALERLGDPIRVRKLTGPNDFSHALTLRTDLNNLCEQELDLDVEHLDWWERWQIIGCLVSHAEECSSYAESAALLDAAKINLAEVLDVRIRQLELAGERL